MSAVLSQGELDKLNGVVYREEHVFFVLLSKRYPLTELEWQKLVGELTRIWESWSPEEYQLTTYSRVCQTSVYHYSPWERFKYWFWGHIR